MAKQKGNSKEYLNFGLYLSNMELSAQLMDRLTKKLRASLPTGSIFVPTTELNGLHITLLNLHDISQDTWNKFLKRRAQRSDTHLPGRPWKSPVVSTQSPLEQRRALLADTHHKLWDLCANCAWDYEIHFLNRKISTIEKDDSPSDKRTVGLVLKPQDAFDEQTIHLLRQFLRLEFNVFNRNMQTLTDGDFDAAVEDASKNWKIHISLGEVRGITDKKFARKVRETIEMETEALTFDKGLHNYRHGPQLGVSVSWEQLSWNNPLERPASQRCVRQRWCTHAQLR